MVRSVLGSVAIWLITLYPFVRGMPTDSTMESTEITNDDGNPAGVVILKALKNLIDAKNSISNRLKEFSLTQETLTKLVDSPIMAIFFATFPDLKPLEGDIKQTIKDAIKFIT